MNSRSTYILIMGVSLFAASFKFKQIFFQFSFLGSLLIFAPVMVWLYHEQIEPLIREMHTLYNNFHKAADKVTSKLDEHTEKIEKLIQKDEKDEK